MRKMVCRNKNELPIDKNVACFKGMREKIGPFLLTENVNY